MNPCFLAPLQPCHLVTPALRSAERRTSSPSRPGSFPGATWPKQHVTAPRSCGSTCAELQHTADQGVFDQITDFGPAFLGFIEAADQMFGFLVVINGFFQ